MDAPDLTPAEFLALDAAFHLALAEASGNQVITATMAGLRSGIEGYARAGVGHDRRLERDLRPPARRAPRHPRPRSRRADAATARTRIHDHISGYYAETFIDPTARTSDPVPSPR